MPKVVTVSIPEYTIDKQPDFSSEVSVIFYIPKCLRAGIVKLCK